MDLDPFDLAEINRAADILRSGGLVAFPTETVYGLGARALDARALMRIFEAKGRPATHPLIAHVLGTVDARLLAADWPVMAARLADALWPGPLTLVIARASHVPGELTGGGDSVAVRAPSHPIARALLRALGEPIAAPSANRYQTLSPTTAAHVAASLGTHVDLIIDGGPCSEGIESTVVDVRGEVPVILRPGAIDLPTLSAIEPRIVNVVPGAARLSDDGPHPSPGMDRRHYAPRTPLVVARNRAAALSDARARASKGELVGLLLVGPISGADLHPGVIARSLSDNPRVYAHALYAALHDLDAHENLSVILVEPVPSTVTWHAVADRINRAREVG